MSGKDLSELLGVSRPYISKKVASSFPYAKVGNYIDVNNPNVLAFIRDKLGDQDWQPPDDMTSNVNSGSKSNETIKEKGNKDISSLLEIPLGQFIDEFGSQDGVKFKNWLLSVKTIEEINEKRIKNHKSKGDLISRDFVKTYIIDYVDSSNSKLLYDAVSTIAKVVIHAVEAGDTLQEVEIKIKNEISSQIKNIKKTVIKRLDKDVYQ